MYGHSGRRGGGMNWEFGIDIYTLPCVKQIASGNLLYSAGSSVWCFVMTRCVGWGFRRFKKEGIYIYI